jgi:hypothetical protein
MESEKLFSDRYIDIEYDVENHWLYTNWKDIQTKESAVEEGERMIHYLTMKKYSKVLNDNRMLKGTWTFSSDYIENQWFPNMVKAGLKYFAWIHSPDVFS